jgi:2-methylcitrate dehydratase PrpD
LTRAGALPYRHDIATERSYYEPLGRRQPTLDTRRASSLTLEAISPGAAVDAAGLAPDVVEVARRCLLDWLGVALAGSREPVAKHVHAAAADWSGSGGRATVLGRPEGAGIVDAALCNGVAGHALDYDDTLAGPFHGHATAPVLPAALALAEHRDARLGDLLAALVAGVASATAIGRAMNPAHYDAGWHSTATLGTFGAATACAHLLALDGPGWERAVALAAVQAAGLTAAFGTMAKPFQVGKAPGNGLVAALLAERGVDAPGDLLECERGVLATHAGRAGDWPAGSDERAILATLFKRHACCHGTHAAIEVVALLRHEESLTPGRVRALRLDVAPAALDICDLPPPLDGLGAKFSLRTVAAMALRGDDTTDPATFDGPLDDPELHDLADRVVVRGDPALSDWQARATLILDDRRVVVRRVDVSVPDKRHGWPALAGKFQRLAAPLLGERRAARVPELVRDLDLRAPVHEVAAAVRVTG